MRTQLSPYRLLIAGLVITHLIGAPQRSVAQDTAASDAGAAEEVVDGAPLLTDDEIDELVAPVALFPDALLAQVLVAATFPLEIVKADRWVAENADLAEDERATAAEAEGWDESVSVLAAGFPTVVQGMAKDIDQTEILGDAMLAQSDDVLDSVQRLRAQADAVGNLETNDAQTVTVEGDNITIAPTDPQVVYVPTYDSQAVYTSAPTSAPVVVDSSSDGFSTGALVTTGLLSFGAGMLVNEIFDDDDDWYGYWGPPRGGYYGRYGPPIGWGGGYVRPRPLVGGIGNDVNIDINRNRVGVRGGDRVANIDADGRWRPDERRRNEARNKLNDRKGRDGVRDRPTARDRDRDALRRKLDTKGGGAAKLKQNRTGSAQRTLDGLKKRQGGGALAKRKAGGKSGAVSRKGGLSGTKKAANRGKLSRDKAGLAKSAKRKPLANKQRAGGVKRPKKNAALAKPKRKAGGGRKAFGRKAGGGRKAGKAMKRGGKSRGGKKFRR
ncbi:MAG: DUF3300 domain-containing protein [Pseudomonadota bacterium]